MAEHTTEELHDRLVAAAEAVIAHSPHENHEHITHLRNVIREVKPRLRHTTEELHEKFGHPDRDNGGGR